MVKVGVLGAGHLGKLHIKLIKEIDGLDLVGFYDPDDEHANQAVADHGLKRYSDIDVLTDLVDAVDIVTPTLSHYECAVNAIKKGKHLFIEKPITTTLDEAKHLLDLVEEANIKAQVGHIERFNPAFLALDGKEITPMFIEAHRLARFNPRGTDVAVVLDLMIHDIAIVLSLVRSNVKSINASGVAVISKTPDIANARIEFDNGCVANLTSSRISVKNMRKTRLFQKDSYISIDFLDKKTEIINLSNEKDDRSPMSFELDTGENGKKFINIFSSEIEEVNALKMELELFKDAIENDTEVKVPVLDGYNALHIAHQILEKIGKMSLSEQ